MNRTRAAFWSGICLVLSAAPAAGSAAYVTATLNLRAEAGTSSAILARIPAGSAVNATDCADGWCKVAWRGRSGYAIQTALDMSGKRAFRRSLRHGPGPVARRPVYLAPRRYVVRPAPDYYYAPPPAFYYGPAPYYYYRPAPYWGPRWGWGWGRGWRRW